MQGQKHAFTRVSHIKKYKQTRDDGHAGLLRVRILEIGGILLALYRQL